MEEDVDVDVDWDNYLELSPEEQIQLDEIQFHLGEGQLDATMQEDMEDPQPAGLRTRVSSFEWERHKRTIKQLYLDDNLSLSQTRKILKETHNFDAP